MTEPDPHEELRRELASLRAEHDRVLASGTYRLARLFAHASVSARDLVRLPVEMFRLARSINWERRNHRVAATQRDALRERWEELAAFVRKERRRQLVVLLSGTTYIQGIRGNRPIRQAQALLDRGVPVLFSYHRARFDEEIPASHTVGLVQSPIDITVALLPEIATADLGDAGKLFVVSYPHPDIEPHIETLRSAGWTIVYDCRDDWEEFAKVGMARWFDASVERRLVRTADRTFCVSQPLVKKMRRLGAGSRVELMPNAVADDFLPPGYRRQPAREPRLVGYFGHLSEAWFDWGALGKIARRRPQLRFEIIGHSAPNDLELPPNVQLLGPRPTNELYRFASSWSAAIIPFRVGPLADAVDPIKIYEYLAFGLPVVSFRMPQIAQYPYTRTVDTVEQFCRALDEACDVVPEQELIDAFLLRNTWEVRVRDLLGVLEPCE